MNSKGRLSAEVVSFLEKVFSYWREYREWPLRIRLEVRERKQGVDLDELLRAVPESLYRRLDHGYEEKERIALTLRGVSHCLEGKTIMDWFLKFLSLGVEKRIADPLGKPRLSNTDFCAIVGADTPFDIRALYELFYSEDCWHAGGQGLSPEGTWNLNISYDIVEYHDVTTSDQYFTRNDERDKQRREWTRRTPESLLEPQLTLLRAIYDEWARTDKCPPFSRLAIEQRHLGSIYMLYSQLPESFTRGGGWHPYNPEQHPELTLDALAAFRPQSDPTLRLAVRLLSLAIENYYKTDGTGTLKSIDLIKDHNLDPAETDRAFTILQHEWHCDLHIDHYTDRWEIKARKNTLKRYEGVHTIEEYIERKNSFRAKETEASESTVTTPPTTAWPDLTSLDYLTERTPDHSQAHRHFMELAIEESRNSKPEDERPHPMVGVVVVKNGEVVATAHRGEAPGNHAEFYALENKIKDDVLAGSTIYVTLEPCTTRGPGKTPCAEWVKSRLIKNVVIGILDPNPNILGKGYWTLLEAGINVSLFDPDIVPQIRDINRHFINQYRNQHNTKPPKTPATEADHSRLELIARLKDLHSEVEKNLALLTKHPIARMSAEQARAIRERGHQRLFYTHTNETVSRQIHHFGDIFAKLLNQYYETLHDANARIKGIHASHAGQDLLPHQSPLDAMHWEQVRTIYNETERSLREFKDQLHAEAARHGTTLL